MNKRMVVRGLKSASSSETVENSDSLETQKKFHFRVKYNQGTEVRSIDPC